MSELRYHLLEPAAGMKSNLAGLFLWQLDDQSRQLTEDTRGATAEELSWQPAPGANTIGMLLAHIAVVEASWIDRALHGLSDVSDGLLPIGRKETAMPLPEGAAAPAALEGRELAFFDDLHSLSRAHTRRELAPLADADLDRRFRRISPSGRVLWRYGPRSGPAPVPTPGANSRRSRTRIWTAASSAVPARMRSTSCRWAGCSITSSSIRRVTTIRSSCCAISTGARSQLAAPARPCSTVRDAPQNRLAGLSFRADDWMSVHPLDAGAWPQV